MERDSRRIIARLLQEGFQLVSTRGSHHKLRKGDGSWIVPHPKKDLPKGTARHIARDSGLDGEGMMKTFIAVVHKDPDSAYGISFPDVPGCFSAAGAFDRVIPNAVEALSLYFEDRPMTEPRGLDAVRAEAAGDIAEGAALIAVPLVVTTRTSARVNISVDKGTLQAIDAAARAAA